MDGSNDERMRALTEATRMDMSETGATRYAQSSPPAEKVNHWALGLSIAQWDQLRAGLFIVGERMRAFTALNAGRQVNRSARSCPACVYGCADTGHVG